MITTLGLDPGALRSRFPRLARCCYLAACSLGPRSVDLDGAFGALLAAMDGSGLAWDAFEEQAARARAAFARLVGAEEEQVAVVPNASVGAYQVASALRWGRRPKIVTTTAEFPSVAHVWLAQRPGGAEVSYVAERDGTVTADAYRAAIDGRTGLVSVPLVTYAHGARLPVAEVAAAAHAAGARCFVDAYQGLGVEPVRVDELGCDFLVGGTMKYLLGLPGVAFLYARDGMALDAPPQLTGWFGRVDPFSFNPFVLDFPDAARRFETGTPAVPALYAANAGLDLIAGLDLLAVRDHVGGLVALAATRLAGQGERLAVADPAGSGAHVAIAEADPVALAAWLAGRDVVVSPRGHLVRLAFHYYSSLGDVDAACDTLAAYREAHGGGHLRVSVTGTDLPPAARRAGAAVDAWLGEPALDPEAFPYSAVVDAYHAGGKHFVPAPLLDALDETRRRLGHPDLTSGADPRVQLGRFLDTALDKRDGRYDYPTYLALSLLELPVPEPPRRDTTCAERRVDRLLAALVCDALAFELAAADGHTGLLPELRPGAALSRKRCRHGLRAAGPALARLGITAGTGAVRAAGPDPEADPVGAAREAVTAALALQDRSLGRQLELTMLPVYVVHDEYLFVRVLQSFETTFSLIGVLLRAAATALTEGDAEPATAWILRARQAQAEAAPLFSLLATMQVEAFRTFRTYTEGASAIQSRTYKTVESLCRLPDRERLDSIAYRSVPEVRARVLAGQATLADALDRVLEARWLTERQHSALGDAMGAFATTLLRWRETHYRLAVRMLGERPGTGYTEGTPYLKSVRTIPVFGEAGTRP